MTTITIQNCENGWVIKHEWDCDEGGTDKASNVFTHEQSDEAVEHLKELMGLHD